MAGSQEEDHILKRFLEGLEQGIEPRSREAVDVLDYENEVPAGKRSVGLQDDLAHGFHGEALAVIRVDERVGMRTIEDLQADLAVSAVITGALQLLRHPGDQGHLAQVFWPYEQVRVLHPARGQIALETFLDVGEAEQVHTVRSIVSDAPLRHNRFHPPPSVMYSPSLLRISRPRFWLYELGTYVLGGVAAGVAIPHPHTIALFWVFTAYFLFPANLLIYGVNDVYDYETDRNNPKKQGYEGLLEPQWHPYVLRRIVLWNAPWLLALPWLSMPAVVSLVMFALCATFYSAPPIRAKARPILDSLLSAGHYVATGVFGYLLVSGTSVPDWTVVIAAMAWCVAMHAYSAVPDIQSDQEAGLSTIATLFGPRGTHLLCALLYTLAALLTWHAMGWVAAAGGAAYVLLMLISYGQDERSLMRLYQQFPLLNAVVGATITLVLLDRSFHLFS